MTISLKITGTERVVEGFQLRVGRVRAAAKSSLDAWAVELAGYIKSTKLSGSPLHRRSGRLSASVHPVMENSSDAVTGGAASGSGVPYAKIHEFGGVINHPGGTAFFVSQLLGGRAFFVSNASAIANSLPRTKPHPIPIPERSYMRSSLREEAPRGIEMLRAAVKEAIA